MRKRKVKVCGMRDPKNILDVAATQPDFMGFIFYRHSKRFVGDDFEIPNDFPKNIQRVGVFVNEDADHMLELVRKHQLNFVQLHGDESAQVCMALKTKTKVIKVFRVDDHFDFNQTKEFDGSADFFMFDTKTSDYGGSGKSFDWSALKKYNQSTPFFLSGGLSPDNVRQVLDLKVPRLFAIDINSGVERAPGLKNVHLINSIIDILNSFPHEIHR